MQQKHCGQGSIQSSDSPRLITPPHTNPKYPFTMYTLLLHSNDILCSTLQCKYFWKPCFISKYLQYYPPVAGKM